MMQASYNTTFGTPSMSMASSERHNKEFGSFTQTMLHETVEDRMSAMMESYKTAPFAGARTDRKKAAEEREAQLQALVDCGILRPSDVFVKKDGKNNTFLAKLLPGTASYYQRIRENKLLFREFGRNEGEQMRIIQEVIESVWLNEGRFLAIDNESNSVVTVGDKELLTIVATDLVSKNSFPTLWKEAKKAKASKANAHRKRQNRFVTSCNTPKKRASAAKDIIGLNITIGNDENNCSDNKAMAEPAKRNVKRKQRRAPRVKLDSELKSSRPTTHKYKRNTKGASGMEF